MVNNLNEITLKDKSQEYAQVVKSLGNGYMEVFCFIGKEKIKMRAHIRGKMRKKIWMKSGDIVLISLREFEKKNCDIIHKYSENDIKYLKNKRLIPKNLSLDNDNYSDDDIDFCSEDSENFQ